MELLYRYNFKQISLFLLISIIIGIASATMPTVLPFVILAAIYGFLLFVIPIKKIYILILFTVFIDVSPISLMGSYVRVSQVLFLIMFLQFLFISAKKGKLSLKTPFMISLFFWYITFFLSFKHIISPHDFYAILIGQLYLYIFYFVIYQYNSSLDISTQLKMNKYFLNGAIFIVIIGILETPLLFAHIIQGFNRGIGIPSPSSLMREPDWYGLVCTYVALFMLTFLANGKSLYTTKKTKLFFYLSCIGMFLSMARASWVAFIFGAFLLFLTISIGRKIKLMKFFFLIFYIISLVILLVFLFSPTKAQNIINRVNPATSQQYDNGASNSRLASIKIMDDYISLHPWVGNGAGGMNKISSDQYIVSQYIDGVINSGRGNANLFLTSLFDSGIIGTFFMVSFIILYLIYMIRAYRKTKDTMILGFLITFISLLTDFMFNNGIRFDFFWAHIALSMSYQYKQSHLNNLIKKPIK